MNIDAIILSNAPDLHYYGMTCRTINSLKNSDIFNEINITVVESQSRIEFETAGLSYNSCEIIHPEQPFGYNKFLNIGLKNTNSEWVLICNNDLFFTKTWLTEAKKIIEQRPDIKSFSPKCPHWQLHQNITEDIVEGCTVSNELCGWCILMHRSLIDTYQLFDEQFDFWYQDDDYSMVLKTNNEKHALMGSSKVYHMISGSHGLLKEKHHEFTYAQQKKFIDKWKKHS
jgi:GT2 family glycosyltransferase